MTTDMKIKNMANQVLTNMTVLCREAATNLGDCSVSRCPQNDRLRMSQRLWNMDCDAEPMATAADNGTSWPLVNVAGARLANDLSEAVVLRVCFGHIFCKP